MVDVVVVIYYVMNYGFEFFKLGSDFFGGLLFFWFWCIGIEVYMIFFEILGIGLIVIIF